MTLHKETCFLFCFFPQRDAQSKKEQWSIKLESSYQTHSECCVVLFQMWRRKAFQRQLQMSLSLRGSNNCDLRTLPIKAVGACYNDDIQEKCQETSKRPDSFLTLTSFRYCPSWNLENTDFSGVGHHDTSYTNGRASTKMIHLEPSLSS